MFTLFARTITGSPGKTTHAPRAGRPRLGDLLIANKLITPAQLQAGMAAQRRNPSRKLGEILVAQKAITELDLRRVLAAQRGTSVNGHDKTEDPAAAPGGPLSPLPDAVRDFAVLDGVVLYIAEGRATNALIESWLYNARRRGYQITTEQCDIAMISRIRETTDQASSATANLSAIRQVRRIFADAVTRGASDIHFTLTRDTSGGYLDVQYRIKGDIVSGQQIPASEGEQIIGSLFQGMASVADATMQDNEDQNGVITDPRFLRGDDGRDIGLTGVRLAKSKLIRGVGVSARLLFHHHSSADSDPLDRLGYSPRQNSLLQEMARANVGINLFTGPTGSGKSTTLAAEIHGILRLRPGVRLITIEDPAEHEFGDPRVWQYHIANANSDEEKSRVFAGKLKASLREDPDIIVVGEIRGLETAREAINAAITGHQVWTTLHVSDPFMIPQRLIAMGVDKFFLSDPKLLSALVAQRLVKALCPHCALPLAGHEDQLSSKTLEHLETWTHGSPFSSLSSVRLRGPGCVRCSGSGVHGRTVISQVIRTDETLLEDLIQNGSAAGRSRYMARPDTEIDMMAHGILKILSGETDPRFVEEVHEAIPIRPVTLRPLTSEDL